MLWNKIKFQQERTIQKSQLVRFTPISFRESKEIVNELKKNNVVIIDISQMPKLEAIRMIDFVAGALLAIGGKYKKLISKTYLIAPKEELLNKFDSKLEV